MTAPDRRIIVAPRARQDVQRAVLRSRQQWGREQSRRYQRAIEQAFETFSANPELGRRREELFPGCRALPVGQHLICYRVDPTAIVVGRVLHSDQDVSAVAFDLPPPESGE